MQLNGAYITFFASVVKAYHFELQKQTKDQPRSKIVARWGKDGSEQGLKCKLECGYPRTLQSS